MGGNRESGLRWDEYVRAPLPVSGDRGEPCGGAFSGQRACIEELVARLAPSRVACLGSGFLNDIPIEALFGTAKEIYFVDWIPGVSFEGVKGRIIEGGDDPRCLFCGFEEPERFCRGYSGMERDGGTVCKSFGPIGEAPLRCDSYVPGVEPHFVEGDVTLGRASLLGRRMERIVRQCDSPKRAFRRAIRESLSCLSLRDELPLKSGGFDFVTSSLLVSQFDAEPYTFFSRLIENKFGREDILAREHVLAPMMEDLRSALYRVQVDGHVAEIYRLLDKGRGKAYLCVEFFRSLPFGGDFFLVQETSRLLDALGRYFFFDFETLPPEEGARRYTMGDGTSVVQGFVLTPKPEDELALA